MVQLEFPEAKQWPVRSREVAPRRPKRPLLGFIYALLDRKHRVGLSDVDIMVLVALAKASQPLRFYKVLGECRGISQSGVWNSLERMDDRGFVLTSGAHGAHVYALSNEGAKKLRYLANK